MIVAGWMLAGLLCLDGEPVAEPAQPSASGAKEEAPRKRLRKQEPAPAEDKAPEPPSEEAPADEGRGIPKPEEDPESRRTDETLERELGQDLEQPSEELDPLSRIGENMREVEELLARTEEENRSVEIQERVVRDLEELLKQAENPPPPSQQKNQSAQAKKRKGAQAQARRRTVAQAAPRPKRGNPTERVGPPASARERPRQSPEERDVWGHLSDTLRAEMSQYAKENFLAKYRDIIERYYTDISRQSTREGD